MKYIVEIAKEYEGYFKGVLICGIVDGKFAVDVIAREDLEELNADYINENYGQLQDDAYQKGFEDGKAVNDKGCEGCKYSGTPQGDSPCFNCSNYYQNNWTAKQTDDEIKVGDIVKRYLNGKLDSTGIYLGEDGDYWNCLFWTGAVFGTFAYPKNQFKKTGRHFDIEKILEEMKHD